MTLALRAEGLSKQVTSPEGSLTILDNVSFTVPQGVSLAICGPSGAGKSTLLALLAGLDLASTGRVWLDDTELGSLDEDGRAALRASRVGFVFQSFHLVPSLTALENVMLPLELAAVRNARDQAMKVIDSVGLTARAKHYPHQLSGGEQQRIAIARAFAAQPAVLFADEPTGNLDNVTGEKIVELLFSLNEQHNTTLVLVTHDEGLAHRCDQRIQLVAGQLQDIKQTGSVD